ncbi:MAG: tyrosine-type recombinase/integrase [Limnochordia bacterium]
MTAHFTVENDVAETIIEDFKQHLETQGLSPATIASYVTDVTQFHDYLDHMGERRQVPPTRFHVTRFRSYLLEQRFQPATINKKINSLAAYDRFLNEHGILQGPIIHPRRDRIRIAAGSQREVDTFTDDEVTRILFHVQQRTCPTRNRLVVELLLYTGVRVSELCNIQLTDMDLLTRTLKVTGKGGTYREIPLRSEVVESIQHYMREERKESRFAESPYLLVSERAPRLHRDAVNNVLRKIGRALKINIYPHKFRHTFCTNLLRKGVPLTTVAKLAGHASIQTTSQFYIQTSRKDMEEAITLL